jgi:putative DNA primase/helicase
MESNKIHYSSSARTIETVGFNKLAGFSNGKPYCNCIVVGVPYEHYEMYAVEHGLQLPEGYLQAKNIQTGVGEDENFKKASELFSGKLKTAQDFIRMQPLYYDDAGLWWVWKETEKCWKMVDEVGITNLLMSVRIETINAKERNEIIQALKQISRINKPKEMPTTWIQFKDKIFDLTNGNEFDASPEYFTVNPVPYSLHPEKFMDTPNMDRIFKEWVGEKYTQMLYEIIAYSLIPDYPIHRLFCFIGGGMNGKSKYLNLIEKFVGRQNVCSTELDALLNSRFEVTRLHKKLVCIMGETNFNELSKTSILKKLTGQDVIGFEYKNKNPFEERNYAKILISTNNLPETTDKTIGFYRRWTIIDFPNQFSEQKDILSDIPEEEYMALATKCAFMILPDLLKARKFTNEGSLEERQKTYEDKSNPFDKFWKENINHSDPNASIPKWEFEKRFVDWCVEHRFRKMTDKFISQKMNEKEVHEVKPYISWYSKEEQKFVQKQVRSWGSIKWK